MKYEISLKIRSAVYVLCTCDYTAVQTNKLRNVEIFYSEVYVLRKKLYVL